MYIALSVFKLIVNNVYGTEIENVKTSVCKDDYLSMFSSFFYIKLENSDKKICNFIFKNCVGVFGF